MIRHCLLLAWLITAWGAGPREVGSAACAACHREIYDSYRRTAMAGSSGRMGEGDFREKFDRGEFRHDRSGIRYRVNRDRQGYFFDFDKAGADATIHGRRPLEFFIGSGTAARSYLFSIDGFLYEAPVSYYSAGEKWGLSPGYEPQLSLYLTRPVTAECLRCHASRLQPIAGTENGFAPNPFLESGVSCERCHGPGSEHAAGGDRQAIVNPASLTPPLRDGVCAQCHLSGEVNVVRAGRDLQGFRPGERLSDYVSVFVWSGVNPAMKVTSHVERLALSGCKRASGERLWCGSCHDPHAAPQPAARAAWYRRKCLGCHETNGCKASTAERRRQADNCIGCHMPRTTVVDAEHTVFTDHSIPRRVRIAAVPANHSRELVPFERTAPAQRELGLAYATLAIRHNDAGFRSRALELLAGAPRDPEVLLHLAWLYDQSSDPARAIPMYEEVLHANPAQVTAAVNLGARLSKLGRVEEAAVLWKQALTRNPGLEAARLNLAAAQFQNGDLMGARATLEKALQINPDAAPARRLLADVNRRIRAANR